MTQHYATRTPLNPRLARLAVADATAKAQGRPPSPRRSCVDLAIAALIGALVFGLLSRAWLA